MEVLFVLSEDISRIHAEAIPEGVEFIELGIVESIEFDHVSVDLGKRGQDVCIKVQSTMWT